MQNENFNEDDEYLNTASSRDSCILSSKGGSNYML